MGPDEPSPPTGCAIARLPEQPGWSLSIVTGADRTGRYIVGRGYPSDPNTDFRRFVAMWFDGALTPIEVPGADQQLADVNASGVAVGFSFDPDTFAPLAPWIYRDGAVSALPGVGSGEALGVNERGDVAGTDRSDGGRVPVWWPAGSTGPVALPLPADAVDGDARDIDEDGTIVRFYTDAELVNRSLAWLPDGSMVELAPPAGLGPETRAFGIGNGWAYGLTTGGPDGFLALRWRLPTGTVQAFPQFDITAQGINRFGWLVGGDPTGRALFVPDRGGLGLRLPGLTDPPRFGNLATAVSDSARAIAGQAVDAAGALRAVRWTCAA